ncbi:MAG: DNA topoisomerase I, partial [Rhodospirillaceae bacterium]|nr:DNA topoisomerase I [Rhodospirillaceae bacterium]
TLRRELCNHDAQPVTVRKGRFGPYVKWGKINATLPAGSEMDTVTLEEAIALVEAKAAKAPAKKATKKKPAKKKAAKKKPAKKTTAKRKPAKKTKAEPADAGAAD